MQGKLVKREEIARQFKWNIEDLYADNALWESDFKRLEAALQGLAGYSGRLYESGQVLAEYLALKDELSMLLERLYVYAHQRSHEDMGNSVYQGYAAQITSLSAVFSGMTAFENPEILSGSEETLKQFIREVPALKIYNHYLMDIIRQKSHTLSEKEESLLALSLDMSSSFSDIFAMFNNADLKFPEATGSDGHKAEITHGRYISLLESKDRILRQSAFEEFYQTYTQFKNSLAAMYTGNLKRDWFYANARKYSSSMAMHLDANAIPVSVYEQLIASVRQHLPLMHRYVSLRKKALGYDELHMYDLFVPIVDNVDMKIPFDDAKSIVLKGLSPLGKDYTDLILKGFEERWIDVYENESKRSGAYSWGAYGTHPYVLLNYQNNLDNTFTLAHEMGHALHTYYSNENQPYVNSGYCIFVAEVASICNESLLTNYLLNNCSDLSEKIYLLDHYLNSFRGTLFRQTMFAEFEMITHAKIAAGESLTPQDLCQIYHQLNVDYYGEDIVIDELIDMEWARIPHFYTPFYVYQYATGFSAATALSSKIIEEGPKAVEAYKQFLSGGGSKYPIDLLKDAGVDMTQSEPVEKALKTFEHVLSEMESLLFH